MVSLGLNSGETVAVVNEASAPSPEGPVLVVTIQGTRISDIPIRVVPVSYNQFEAMLSSSLLDELYPTRPINAASGNCPVTGVARSILILFQ